MSSDSRCAKAAAFFIGYVESALAAAHASSRVVDGVEREANSLRAAIAAVHHKARADSAVPSSHVSETDHPSAPVAWRYKYLGTWHLTDERPDCDAQCVMPLYAESPKAEGESILREALARCVELFDKALPKFNWGASCLDAEAITLLNEVPEAARSALAGIPR